MQSSPEHIAIIMDGNGRWATQRGLPRTAGHKRGAKSVRRIVENAAELGVSYLTLFGFSSENWNRPVDEIRDLMGLLRFYLRSETAELHRKNVRLNVIGERNAFDADIIKLIENAESVTSENTGICVNIALNYGGRTDILKAAQALASKTLEQGAVMDDIAAEDIFSQSLSLNEIPEPDLLIRTSGEQRISNFLLWQCAYSEMVFTPTLWPDFSMQDLKDAINEYAQRDRRFGGISAQSKK